MGDQRTFEVDLPPQPAPVYGRKDHPPAPVPGYEWQFHATAGGGGSWVAVGPGGPQHDTGIVADVAHGASDLLQPAADAVHEIGEPVAEGVRAAGDGARDIVNAVANAAGLGGSGPLPDISGIQGDARELYRKGLANMDREYTAGTIAPQAVMDPGLAPSERVTAAGPVTAERVAAAAPVGAERVSAAGPVNAERVNAPNLGAAAQVGRPVAFDAATAKASGPAATTIDTGQSNQIRDIQMQNLQTLQKEAQGGGISAELARAQLARHMARITGDQMAMAGAARGAGRTGLQREAMLAAGRQGLEAALGAEEQALGRQLGAQQQVTGALQGTREQDVGVATQQAQLDAQRRNLQAQLETATAQGNAQEINRLRMSLTDLDQQAQQYNAGATNQRGEVQGRLGLEAATGNADRSLNAGLDAARRQDAAAVGNADRGLTAGLDTARRQDAAATGNADRGLTADLDYARRQDTTATDNAGRADTQAFREGQQNVQVQTGNADRALTADTAQEGARRGAFDSTTGAQQAGGTTASQGLGAQTDAIAAQAAAKKAADEAKARDREFLLDAATKAAPLLSDERAKKDVVSVDDDDLSAFAEDMARKMKRWEYKPGLGPEGEHAGPMAQDVEEAGEVGKLLVHKRPDGMREIDQSSMTNLLLAALLRRRKAA